MSILKQIWGVRKKVGSIYVPVPPRSRWPSLLPHFKVRKWVIVWIVFGKTFCLPVRHWQDLRASPHSMLLVGRLRVFDRTSPRLWPPQWLLCPSDGSEAQGPEAPLLTSVWSQSWSVHLSIMLFKTIWLKWRTLKILLHSNALFISQAEKCRLVSLWNEYC